MQHKAEKENTGTANCNEVNNHLKLKPGERMRQREWFCYQLGESQRDVYMGWDLFDALHHYVHTKLYVFPFTLCFNLYIRCTKIFLTKLTVKSKINITVKY